MIRILSALIFTILISGRCSPGGESKSDTDKAPVLKHSEIIVSDGIEVRVFDYEGLKPLFIPDNDTLYVINFWATWCKPCIKELPYFNRIHHDFHDQPVKVVLVSLDMVEHARTGLIPFILKNNIDPEVILLDDPDANNWIPQIDKNWSGSIPATLFIKGNNRSFHENEFEYEALKSLILSFL